MSDDETFTQTEKTYKQFNYEEPAQMVLRKIWSCQKLDLVIVFFVMRYHTYPGFNILYLSKYLFSFYAIFCRFVIFQHILKQTYFGIYN